MDSFQLFSSHFKHLKTGAFALAFTVLLSSVGLSDEVRDAKDFFQRRSAYCQRKNLLSCEKAQMVDAGGEFSELDVFLSCRKFYDDHRCETVKNLTAAADRKLLMSCEPDEICRDEAAHNLLTCSVDGVLMQFEIPSLFALGVGVGATAMGANALVAAIPMMPFLIYSGAKTAQECDADRGFKKASVQLHNLSLLQTERPLDIEGQNKDVLKMPCSDLKFFLDARLETFVHKRGEAVRWSLNPQIRNLSPASKALQAQLNSKICFNKNRLKDDLCKTISGFLTGVVVGGSAQGLVKFGENKLTNFRLTQNLKPHEKKILDDLTAAIENADTLAPHKIQIWNGKAQVKIGHLGAHQIQVFKALQVAIKAGLVQQIDTGGITGPKALNLMLRWQELAPAGQPLQIIGHFEPQGLMKQLAYELRSYKDPFYPKGERDPMYWNPSELNKFNKAVQDLKLAEACQKFYGATLEACGKLNFTLDAANPNGNTFSKP